MSTESVIMQEGTSCGSAPASPKNKIKFLCSHGGKNLPSPADGHLKYVGGQTRVISVPKEIKFLELMKKLKDRVEGEMVLKYQLVPEDLDALVSVKSDEDLRHVFDEYERHETAGTARLRAFLFPARPVVLANHMETHGLEQRYIDALNGIVRSSSSATAMKQYPLILNTSHGAWAIAISSSACPSPRSPESCLTDATIPCEATFHSYLSSGNHMHRVHSSPTIYNLNASPQQNSSPYPGHNCCTQTTRNNKTPDRLISVRSVGRAESIQYQMDNTPPYSYSHCKHPRGSGYCSKSMNYDEYGSWSDRRQDRAAGLSLSPLSMSPRGNTIAPKPWYSAIAQHS